MKRNSFVYICSPFRGDRLENIRKAEEYSRFCYKTGNLPLCVHIYLERATGLDENNGEREELLRICKEFVKKCDELWIFGERISEGMLGEINVAKKRGIKIRRFKEVINEKGFIQEM